MASAGPRGSTIIPVGSKNVEHPLFSGGNLLGHQDLNVVSQDGVVFGTR